MSTEDMEDERPFDRGLPLSLLVVILSIVAVAASVPSRGLSLVVVPLFAVVIVGRALRPLVAWAYGLPYVAAFVVYGCYGLGTYPVLLAGILILLFRLNRPVATGVTIAGLAAMLLCVDGGAVQKARYVNDSGHVRQILLSIQLYHDETGGYPDRLSRLSKVTSSLYIFASPRGAGEQRWLEVGPLRIWLRKYSPGPVRRIREWLDVDDGDYLYRHPGSNASTNTIIIMTRPGLLYRNCVNVGRVDGEVRFLGESTWKTQRHVVAFLRDLRLSHYLSLTTGDE